MPLDSLTPECDGRSVGLADANDDWLRTAAAQGHGAVAYQLGLTCTDPDERRYWFREAAHENYPLAMYAFALECDRLSERRKWLRKAARAGHPAAIGCLDEQPLSGIASVRP
jgi:hypothetical protein